MLFDFVTLNVHLIPLFSLNLMTLVWYQRPRSIDEIEIIYLKIFIQISQYFQFVLPPLLCNAFSSGISFLEFELKLLPDSIAFYLCSY